MTSIEERVHPMPGQQLGHVKQFVTDSGDEASFGAQVAVVSDLAAANVVTSVVGNSDLFTEDGETLHKPLLDIDLPVKVVPSTTPGHGHLYIDKALTWSQYRALLTVLAELGIIQEGYCDASLRRGYTTLRLPWIKKSDPVVTPHPDDDIKPF